MFFFRERPTANLSIIDDKLMLNKDIYIYIYIYIYIMAGFFKRLV